MQLIRLSANKNSFRTVEFNKTGLSFIVAKQKHPGESDRGKTYNGVGKSLLIVIIHFCLGADKKHYITFSEKLPNWNFTLEFQIGGQIFLASRRTDEAGNIVLNNKPLSVAKFNEKLQSLCFDIPEGISYLSFRSLLPFFIRPRKESYVSFDAPGKTGSEYQKQIYNSFLLGLDVHLAQEKYKIRKEQDRIKKLTDNFRKDDLLKEFFTGDKDILLALPELNEQIDNIEKDLNKFEVAEDYYETKTKADKIERDLSETKNNITLIENQIKNIEESLIISPDLGRKTIENAYQEVQIIFPDKISKTIDQLEKFYRQLIENRTHKLLLHKQSLLQKWDKNKLSASELGKELNGHLQYLGAHQALDVFIKVNEKLTHLKSKRDSLQKYSQLIDEYDNKSLTVSENLLAATKRTAEYLKNMSEIIDSIRECFRKLAKKFYPDVASGITITNNDGENQMRYNIDAKIEADASDGINNVKIFCYDMSILFMGFGHSIKFLFHDSRIFDGIDERQKAELFRIVYNSFNNSSKQYIASVNQNQLEEIKKYLTNEEFDRIINEKTVLTLTDDSDSAKLLGIKVDLRYE
jgi:uncharacterized protein YydD (DUF2326 family)